MDIYKHSYSTCQSFNAVSVYVSISCQTMFLALFHIDHIISWRKSGSYVTADFLQVAASVRTFFFLFSAALRQRDSLLRLAFLVLVVYYIEHVSRKVFKSAHRRLHLSGDKTSLWVDYLSAFIYLMSFFISNAGYIWCRGGGSRDCCED